MLVLRRFTSNAAMQLLRRATYSSAARVKTQSTDATTAAVPATSSEASQEKSVEAKHKGKSSLVATAFELLKANDNTAATLPESDTTKASNAADTNLIDERIIKAKTVNGLLAISENNTTLTRPQALKIVSILADWSTQNRIKVTEFESDSRFLRLCRVLGRTIPKGNNNNYGKENASSAKRISGFRTDDLNTVLGVAGDDEAAKLIASISVPQMVKVMSTLAQRKRRSTPLLRSLAFNISSSTDQLDLKQCGDVLYAMASLNFQDSVLAAKLCADIQHGLSKNVEKSAVVGSILTSLGILKYRDLDILEALTQWMLKYQDICRSQDLSAYFHTCAILNFKSTQLEDVRGKLVNCLGRADFSKPLDWLNYTWALALLDMLDNTALQNVLSPDFVNQLETSKERLSVTSKMKLLNLNGFAQLLAVDYKGDLLSADSQVFDVPLAHNKTKQILLNALLDALKSLLPANNHVESLVDSRMGFLIDAVCLFDAKRNPLPCNKEYPNAIKVALMVVDFHDICHGSHRSASGVTNLNMNLLEKSGYKVIPVPFNEFNTSEKLLKRVQYLDAKFKKAIVTS